MRVRTEHRRQAIVGAAAAVFREKGFDRASMDAVAARVGGSKATLYGYFPSKAELFLAVVEDALLAPAVAPFDALSAQGDLRERLARFAGLHLEFRLQPDILALERLLIAASERSDLGGEIHARYVEPQMRRLGETLAAEMDSGRLRRADPQRAAKHFRLLAEGDLIERRLRGDGAVDETTVTTEVAEAVDAFLRAYAPRAGRRR
ncbi:MAG: TetR/AcrR family transcriptional regulator [Caulobacteraceae bacterium]|nr:TetR/AcrR family transcriptional regulator [Caulobacteraceae bacterium]